MINDNTFNTGTDLYRIYREPVAVGQTRYTDRFCKSFVVEKRLDSRWGVEWECVLTSYGTSYLVIMGDAYLVRATITSTQAEGFARKELDQHMERRLMVGHS